MVRDIGWSEYSAAGVLNRQYACFNGLGSINSGAQPYYQINASDAPTDFPFADQFNVAVQVYGDATNGNFDKRTFAKTFVREYAKKYKDSVLADTGKTATGAYKVDFLISNEDDLKITANDAAMSGAPYSGITITYFATDQMKTVGGGSYPYRIVVDGNGATLEQIYTKVQYLLRQNSDIDAGAGNVTGKTAALLMEFKGDTLQTLQGVFIDNIQTNDVNRIILRDYNGVDRQYNYVAAGTLAFNSFLVGAGSSYRLLFLSPPGAGNDYGESGAITVNDGSGVPIAGSISAASVGFTFDYDNNTQGGYSGGTDRPVVLVGVRPGYGKYAVAFGTLTRAKGLMLSLVAEQDRAYA
jgi:hypothetical protein